MKILLINKFHYKKGGSETYYFNLARLLAEHGHEVMFFSMQDERNVPSEYSRYFVENIDYHGKNTAASKIKLALKFIYSFEASQKLDSLIKYKKPDIAHLHIFQHQLSPSILWTLKKHDIPIVYTAHDFKMICPNYKMLDKSKICEACKGGKYINCLKRRCMDDSFSNSFLNTAEAYMHKFLKSYDLIDMTITPSNFYRKKFIDFGINPEKITYVPNFLFESDYFPNYNFEDYFLYFGRLSEEKGVDTLLSAMKHIDGKLKIAGIGTEEEKLETYAENEGLGSKVEFLGHKSGIELENLIKNAMFTVVPSKWYENAPYSVLESMAFGKTVVGSHIGGIPEMILDKKTGLLFYSDDSGDLAEKINDLMQNTWKIINYGKNARTYFEEVYGSEEHYRKIIKIYENLISGRQNGNQS